MLEGTLVGVVEVRGRILHLEMLAVQHLEDRPTGLGTGIVRLQDVSLIPLGQGVNCRLESAAEDPGIECPCQGVLIWDGVRAMATQHLRLGVVNQG